VNLIEEISEDLGKEDLEWEESAMAAVQQASEEYLVELVSMESIHRALS
jgi:histone H3/H4